MMRLFKYVLFFLVFCGGVFVSDALAENGMDAYRLLVFGDSLSAGYRLKKDESFAAQLQAKLIQNGYPQVEVLNDSLSGETTAGGLKRVSGAIRQNPDAVLLELGINDAFRGESIDVIEARLSELIERFQNAGAAVLLIGMKAPPVTGADYANRFSTMYESLAKKYNLILYPFFMSAIFKSVNPLTVQLSTFQSPYLQSDHVHPTKEGVAQMTDDIFPTVKRFLKKQGMTPIR